MWLGAGRRGGGVVGGGWGTGGRGFPDSWLGTAADGTELAVCVDAEVGEFQEFCRYSGSSGTVDVWFFAHLFTIKAYELRTGELVADYTREIGDACPDTMDNTFETVYLSWSGSSMSLASEFTDADFRGMFSGIVGA